MRQGFVYLMAVSVCLALAFTPLMADRTADRTKSATRGATSTTDWNATVGDGVMRHNNGPREAQNITTQSKALEIVAQAASLEGQAAAGLLMSVVQMDLPQNAETEKMLGDVYHQLGDLYEGTATKQVHWYSLAMQYTSDPGARAQLESRIQALGGDAFALSATPNTIASTRDAGYDTCEDAMAVALDFTANMSIIAWGDHDWFAFDVPGPDGLIVDIWTCDEDPYADTDLNLYDGCPGNVIASNDDWFAGPSDLCYPATFLSHIETGCMAPGTYYVEVGGWSDFSTPQDFDINITVQATCVLPAPDGYEPDDVREDAADIGHPTSIPLHANGWGRAKKEIQDRNIFPIMNSDFVAFRIERDEIVTMETNAQFPTFFNDFTTVGTYDNPDTYIELYYGIEPNYGGYCNNPDAGFPDGCMTDADCEGLIINPLPIWPDCIPVQYFTVGGEQYWFWENPLAFNDDGGAGFASMIQACIPRGDQQTTSGTAAGDWLVRVWPYSASAMFDYQLMVRNETPCAFEVEPNNDFPYATPMVWGAISGIMDESNFGGLHDVDLYSFDVEVESIINFETWGPDATQSDTGLELYVGPDDLGLYYFTGVQNDDCYVWLSCIENLILPPANELLGNLYADADYLMNVTTFWLNKNFLYTLLSDKAVVPNYVYEVEPNDTCATAQGLVMGDDELLGELHDYDVYGYCDYDSYTFTVTANSFVTMETDALDTAIALYDDGGAYLGCDDDNGTGYIFSSLLQGCLPPGDYCLQVRGYSYFNAGAYQLEITDGGTCSPTSPVYLGETGLTCDGFGYANGQDEFENGCF